MKRQHFHIETEQVDIELSGDGEIIEMQLAGDVPFLAQSYPFTMTEARQLHAALEALLSEQPATDYLAKLYFSYRDVTYRFKVFPNAIIGVERQSPKSGPNRLYERDARPPYNEDTQAWDFGILRYMIDKYERDTREES
jgi:hypothetical protein